MYRLMHIQPHGHVHRAATFLISHITRPNMAINPLIIKGIESLDAPDSVKQVLHDVLEVEDSDMAWGDREAVNMSIKRILKECTNNKEVVEFCDKHG